MEKTKYLIAIWIIAIIEFIIVALFYHGVLENAVLLAVSLSISMVSIPGVVAMYYIRDAKPTEKLFILLLLLALWILLLNKMLTPIP